uniref:Metalloendopeptidase n=1 Tax=Panagrolaimus sp. ES5 TaxID=591445 RepID=A0AC34F021_9BILA
MAAFLKLSSLLLFLTLLFLANICRGNKVKNIMDSKLDKIKQRLSGQMKGEEVDEIVAKLAKLRGIGKQKFAKKNGGGELKKLSLTTLTAKTNVTDAAVEKSDDENVGMKSVLFQGDMMLSSKQLNKLIAIAEKENEENVTDDTFAVRSKRQAMGDESGVTLFNKKLPIYYKFDETFSDETKRDLFRRAAADWTDHSCLNLVELLEGQTGKQQIIVQSVGDHPSGLKCFSYWGYTPGGTLLNLYDGCELYETYAHEIGHALGFYHTFARWDRDDYVHVKLTGNEEDDYQFKMETPESNNNFGLPYDLESIMHYPSDPVTGDMTAIDTRRKYIIGSENLITFTDYNMLNKLYKCEASCSAGGETCQNGGFRNPKSCDVCICPRGFTGNDCSEEATHEYTDIQCGGSLTATSASKTKLYTLNPNYAEKHIEAATCNWHIHAPSCKQIKVQFTTFTGPTINSFPCSDFGLEFRGEQIEIAGFRICKSNQISTSQSPKTFTAE